MNLKEIKFEMAAEAVNPKAELELIRLDRAVRFGSASLSRDRAGWCIDYCDAGTECAETFDMAGNFLDYYSWSPARLQPQRW